MLSRSWTPSMLSRAAARLNHTYAYAITPKQQQRIIAAAEFWLGQHRGHEKMDMRFDAILIAPGVAPRHIINAFDASP